MYTYFSNAEGIENQVSPPVLVPNRESPAIIVCPVEVRNIVDRTSKSHIPRKLSNPKVVHKYLPHVSSA